MLAPNNKKDTNSVDWSDSSAAKSSTTKEMMASGIAKENDNKASGAAAQGDNSGAQV
jgi:hypothetical protein